MALASFLEADPARLIVLGYVAEREEVVVGRSPLVRLLKRDSEAFHAEKHRLCFIPLP